jgi:hypothetical protein
MSKIENINDLPVSKVIFFQLKEGNFITNNGKELTAEFLSAHHSIMRGNEGYVILENKSEKLLNIITEKRDRLDSWINSKNKEIQHDFIMATGNRQLLYVGELDVYNEIIQLINEL